MRKLICLLNFIFIFGCSASDKIIVRNVQDLTAYGPNTFIYSLPRTKIKINISALRHYTIPGPYYQYAEKYLGLTGVSSAVKTWELNRIDFETIDEPDPDYYYAVEANKSEELLKNVLAMSEAGLILKVDASNPFVQYIPEYSNYSDQKHFTDLSIKRNYIDPNEPEKVKIKKSNFHNEPPTRKQKAGIKTIEQKAEEAANFIYKIRKRRFKLIAGQYDTFPDGVALEMSIRELSKLEEDYLSLFVGKTYTDTVYKSFYYIPQPDLEIDRFVICYFSTETGFEDSQVGAGKSLVLELKDMQLTASLDKLEMPSSGNKNCLMYRIPDKASVNIYNGSLTSIEGEIKVYQYGTLAPYCINGD
jgi:hypothetical protein